MDGNKNTKDFPSSPNGTKVHLIKEVFKDVLENNLIVEPKLLSALDSCKLITKDDVEELSSGKTQIECAKLLLSKLADDDSSMEKFLYCLKEKSDERGNQDIASYIEDEKPLPGHSERHIRFCEEIRKHSSELIGIIVPTDMIDVLSCLSIANQEIIKNAEENRGQSSAALSMLLFLRRSPADWPCEFMKAFEKNGYDEKLGQILKKAYISNEDSLPTKPVKSNKEEEDSDVKHFSGGHHESDVSGDLDPNLNTSSQTSLQLSDHVFSKPKSTDKATEKDIDEKETLVDPSETKSGSGFDISRILPDNKASVHASASGGHGTASREKYEKTDMKKSDKFYKTLRDYQRSLAKPALKKLNTVLVAPTGTGKTHVAAYIIDQHLNELEEEGKRGKVVFIVPAVRLAKQQRDKLDELIGSPTRDIRCVVGQDIDVGCSLLSVMRGENVCITVMTAQVLLNGLLEPRSDNRVSWNDITLLVADECHNTQKGHAYNKIMKQYLRRARGKEGGDKLVPQIVGMTANLGTGGKGNTEDAMNHIYKVCANLDAKVIQPVEDDKDLLTYLNIPKDIGPIILNPRKRDAFKMVLETIMYEIEKKIATIVGAQSSEPTDVSTLVRQCPRDTQNYETWIAEFRNKCLEGRDLYEEKQYQALIAYLDNLKVYQQALCIHRDVRPKNALRHLDAAMEELAFRSGEANDKLIQLFKDFREQLEIAIAETDENPLLKWIKEKLVDTFRDKPESGVLLFTRTRAYTKALLEWLKEEQAFTELDLKPAKVTGVQDPEMTKSEGDAILANFRLRRHKIIVATNVLEEGIDLRACNLVLRHNYVPSEVGHTQVKGRGRAENSESFLVALTETGRDFKQQEMDNKAREQWAEAILKEIASTSPLEVEDRIRKLQTATWRKEWLESERDVNTGVHDTSEWRLLCLKCPQDVCSSSDVVRFRESKYVVTSGDFIEKCQVTRFGTPNWIKSYESINGKIYCGNCRQDWGAWCTYESKDFPLIKIEGFAMKNIKTHEVKTCKKWKKVPFKVRDVDDITMLPGMNSAELFGTD